MSNIIQQQSGYNSLQDFKASDSSVPVNATLGVAFNQAIEGEIGKILSDAKGILDQDDLLIENEDSCNDPQEIQEVIQGVIAKMAHLTLQKHNDELEGLASDDASYYEDDSDDSDDSDPIDPDDALTSFETERNEIIIKLSDLMKWVEGEGEAI